MDPNDWISSEGEFFWNAHVRTSAKLPGLLAS
jgi:hypothetical protein